RGGAPAADRPLPRAGAHARGIPRLRAAAGADVRGGIAGGCDAGALRRNPAGRRDRPRLGAGDGGVGRGGGPARARRGPADGGRSAPGLAEVRQMVDEASQVRAYSRQLEQKSRELEATTAEALRARAHLLDLTHDSVVVRDLHDRITFWNRGAETLYGWTQDEAIGQGAHHLLQMIFPAPLAAI